MHNLIPITPLGGRGAQTQEFEGITISEMPDFAYASVAMRLGKKTSFRRAAKKAMEILPPAPGESAAVRVGEGLLTIFWIGVDQWIVEAPYAAHADLAAHLHNILKDNASVTEQSDGWARFDLKGEGCFAVLERLSMVDIAKMHAGATTRTSIEHVNCFLVCRDPPQHFSVICPRSFAEFLYHSMLVTAKSAL